MNCASHDQTPASAYCRTCGRALCAQCQRTVRGVIYCEHCIAERLGETAPPAGVTPGFGAPPVAPTHTPSPALAALLGFIPGVGAMYNGQFVKGLVHVAIFIALVFAAANLPNNVDWVPGIGIAFWILYMAFDAYRTARALEAGVEPPDPFGFDSLWESGRTYRRPAAPAGYVAQAPAAGQPMGFMPSEPAAGVAEGAATVAPALPAERPAAPVGAIILIAIGALFLLSTFDVFRFYWLGDIWPLFLIALGIWIFLRKRACNTTCRCPRCQANHLMGPAVLVTLGLLFLLQDTHSWSFDRSWPVLLIVIGAVLIIRHSASSEGHVPLSQRTQHLDERMQFLRRELAAVHQDSQRTQHLDERMQRKMDRYQEKIDRMQEKIDRKSEDFQRKMDRFHERMVDAAGGRDAGIGFTAGRPRKDDEVPRG